MPANVWSPCFMAGSLKCQGDRYVCDEEFVVDHLYGHNESLEKRNGTDSKYGLAPADIAYQPEKV